MAKFPPQKPLPNKPVPQGADKEQKKDTAVGKFLRGALSK